MADVKARLEGGEKWIPLKELCAPELARRARKPSQGGAHVLDAHEVERQIAMDRARGGGGAANVGVGLAMIVAGVVLTLISTSRAGGGGAIFVGLVIFGIARVIRGAAS
jgi:hypothetical protein